MKNQTAKSKLLKSVQFNKIRFNYDKQNKFLLFKNLYWIVRSPHKNHQVAFSSIILLKNCTWQFDNNKSIRFFINHLVANYFIIIKFPMSWKFSNVTSPEQLFLYLTKPLFDRFSFVNSPDCILHPKIGESFVITQVFIWSKLHSFSHWAKNKPLVDSELFWPIIYHFYDFTNKNHDSQLFLNFDSIIKNTFSSYCLVLGFIYHQSYLILTIFWMILFWACLRNLYLPKRGR